jgi:hypothetical protein
VDRVVGKEEEKGCVRFFSARVLLERESVIAAMQKKRARMATADKKTHRW